MTCEGYDTIEEAAAALARGEMIVVQDDEQRENEGDLIFGAEFASAQTLAFMVKHTSGVICVSMEEERLAELELPQMVQVNTEPHRTAFTISVDYRHGTSTGISAADRAITLQKLCDPSVKACDFARPGHIFPLRYRQGGVLKRAGHTEAAIDLLKIAGCYPAGVICEIVKEDGSMARTPDLEVFAREHGLKRVTIADLVRYRRRHEKLVRKISEARIPTDHGEFTASVYESLLDGIHHIALHKGDLKNTEAVLVRVHSECLTGDVFGSTRCDCGRQLHLAMKMISDEGAGAVVYLRGHEGRGIGIAHKLRAYELQDAGCDTVEANLRLGLPADSREYGIGAQILADLGVSSMRIMTNNPAKYGGLDGFDLRIVDRIPLICPTSEECKRYLQTKQDKMGHWLNMDSAEKTHA
ncbi:MAG: bifunctional 3,4-dihydroxy-2-butanone-4-phosphate synthase/GTP cyclohydrolase II [Chlamydiia bacterium]|nr:bifunctional 3,4-dihydroxy-2-butanone-4-phosphate synthase/GTP cyclohydrolase II [Chlamydiia bacterium]